MAKIEVGGIVRLNENARVAAGLSVEVVSIDDETGLVTVRVKDGRSAYRGMALAVPPAHLVELAGNQQVRQLTAENSKLRAALAAREVEVGRLHTVVDAAQGWYEDDITSDQLYAVIGDYIAALPDPTA